MLSDIEMAQDDYNINVKDTHRADKKRKSQKKKSKEKGAAKKKLKFFEKNVQDVNIDVVARLAASHVNKTHLVRDLPSILCCFAMMGCFEDHANTDDHNTSITLYQIIKGIHPDD